MRVGFANVDWYWKAALGPKGDVPEL